MAVFPLGLGAAVSGALSVLIVALWKFTNVPYAVTGWPLLGENALALSAVGVATAFIMGWGALDAARHAPKPWDARVRAGAALGGAGLALIGAWALLRFAV